MSLEIMPSERVCYVDCNFCNTILAVSVPCSSLFHIVTVRCGHCTNLLSVNVGASFQTIPPPHEDPSHQRQILSSGSDTDSGKVDSGSSSKCKLASHDSADENEQPRLPPIRPPEKRQRVPSAYNKFIKEEIQRIKASNPDISHRQAFSTAAKNWAHFPHMHFEMKLDGTKKQAKSFDHQPIAGSELGSTTQKSTTSTGLLY